MTNLPLTMRIVLALATGFFLVIVASPYFIAFLKRLALQENTEHSDSEELNKLHSDKSGTPTMGGALVMAGCVVPTVLWSDLTNSYVLIMMATLLGFGAIGAVDDLAKVRGGGGEGLTAKGKFAMQLALSCLLGVILYYGFGRLIPQGSHPLASPLVILPGGYDFYLTLFPLGMIFVAVVITGSSNAVNLTDGLDGLAAGSAVPVIGALMAVGYASSNFAIAQMTSVVFLPGTAELLIVLAGLMGGLLGFLWYNCYPAQMFMGDTGSLSVGAVIGLTAIILNQTILLVFMAGIFVVETLSVILQVGSYKLRKKRIFRIAPLHHHYQFGGLNETKITVRFWIVSIMLAMVTVAGVKMGI